MAVSAGPELVRARAPAAYAADVALFAGAVGFSAFLLFSVQPMFTKMVLPVLGGSPAVWSVALVFFQAMLLAGYCYAHLLARWRPRRAVAVHLGVMLAAAASLPIALPAGWTGAPAGAEALWTLGLFAAAVGLPFFAVAANGPLLQAWFARSGHPRAADPYFLYAASNVGSFAALVSYPLAIEPAATLRQQSAAWFGGFALLAGLIAACALALRSGALPASPAAAPRAPADRRSAWRERGAWIALAFVPSALLTAVTAHLSTDIAAAPLLWVVPLGIYLLTFVVAFREASPSGERVLVRAQVWATALAFLDLRAPSGLATSLALHLGLFFVSATISHRALYRLRPAPVRLTEFYVCMSLGGLAGGAACGLAAPQVFSRVLEYPILAALALACRPGFFAGGLRSWGRETGFVALLGIMLALAYAAARALLTPKEAAFVVLALAGAAAMAAWDKPRRLAPAAVALLLLACFLGGPASEEAFRSFFGVHKLATTADGRFVTLAHSTTIHGAMRIRNDDGAMRIRNDDGTPAAGPPEPTTYYTREGGIGAAIASVRAARGGSLGAVAVVGLGAGSLACHAADGETWRFFELDAEVVRIARDPRRFRFLSECAPEAEIRLGDARLTLAAEPARYGIIVVDAFSSDAIPAHLITAEALAMYRGKLAGEGVIVVHISNRHLDLRRVLARTAAAQGLVTHVVTDKTDEPPERRYRTAAVVALLASEPAHLGAIASAPGVQRIVPDMTRRPWTDDFSNVVEAFLDNLRR